MFAEKFRQMLRNGGVFDDNIDTHIVRQEHNYADSKYTFCDGSVYISVETLDVFGIGHSFTSQVYIPLIFQNN